MEEGEVVFKVSVLGDAVAGVDVLDIDGVELIGWPGRVRAARENNPPVISSFASVESLAGHPRPSRQQPRQDGI